MKWAFRILIVVVPVMFVAAGGYAYWRSSRIDRLSSQCVAASTVHDWKRLEKLSRDWLELDDSTSGRYWLGLSLKFQKKFAEADEVWSTIPIDQPRGIDAAAECAEIQFHVFSRPLEAIETCQQLLRIDDRLASARRHLIYFDAMALQRVDLIHQIRKAIQDQVDLPEHYLHLFSLENLVYTDSVEVTRKWHEADPASSFLEAVYLSRRYLAARLARESAPGEGHEEALETLLTEIEPRLEALRTFSSALGCLIQIAIDRDQPERVAALLGDVSDELAEDPVFWGFRAWYAKRQGNSEEAEKDWQRVLEIYPLSWRARHELAELLRARGENERAGQIDRLAGEGSQLAFDLQRLKHARDFNWTALKRLADYAERVGEPEVAHGITRRWSPSP